MLRLGEEGGGSKHTSPLKIFLLEEEISSAQTQSGSHLGLPLHLSKILDKWCPRLLLRAFVGVGRSSAHDKEELPMADFGSR